MAGTSNRGGSSTPGASKLTRLRGSKYTPHTAEATPGIRKTNVASTSGARLSAHSVARSRGPIDTTSWPAARSNACPTIIPAPRGVRLGHGPERYGLPSAASRQTMKPPAKARTIAPRIWIGMLPLVDYHVHTARCGHAVGAMERYVERAIESGLKELGFSDHLFMYWLPADRRDPELGMAEWEHDFYIEDVERCRRRYTGDITIRLSTEADFIPGHEKALESIVQRYDWDYVIGSVHFLGEWGFDDSRQIAEFEQRDIDALYAQYFETVGASAETGLFDTIGHIDLIKKFGHRATADLAGAYTRLAQRLAR